MSEGVSGNYLVRDPQGNVYGPADAQMLRAWVQQGRIVAGMAIAAQETREWVDAAQHPAVADLLQAGTRAITTQPAGPTPMGAVMPFAVQPYPGTAGMAPYCTLPRRQNSLGLLSLIFGVASMLVSCIGICVPFLSLPLSGLSAIAAITLGCLAISQMRTDPATYTGQGMAAAGIVLGGTMLVLLLIAAVVMVITIAMHH